MANDLETAIRENAEGPDKASGDSGSIEQHKLLDQIAADRYLCTKEALIARQQFAPARSISGTILCFLTNTPSLHRSTG